MSILRISHLNVGIENKIIVSDGSLNINENDVVLLTGPNGCGKSTVIKIIMGDTFDYKRLSTGKTEAWFCHNGTELDILSSDNNMELFRRNVCYVSQDDTFESDSLLDCFLISLNYCDIRNKEQYIFDFVRKFSIQDCFNVDFSEKRLDHRSCRIANKLSVDIDRLSDDDKRAIKLLGVRTSKLSGGQKKLANIVTNLVKCEFCNLIILDEPLNNLDYNNVRLFSNVLTQIHHEYPKIGILIVTHCRSIPIINKVVEIDTKINKLIAGQEYFCTSCFGRVDEHQMYR